MAGEFERLVARGDGVAITTASAGTARAINVEIQRRRHPRRGSAAVALADGTVTFVGDRVATRRNVGLLTDTGAPVRNRQTWTVTDVGDDGSLLMSDPSRGCVRLPAAYVARHVELGWAVTGYGTQGITTDHAIAVIEPPRNLAWIVDRTGLADAEANPNRHPLIDLPAVAETRPRHSATSRGAPLTAAGPRAGGRIVSCSSRTCRRGPARH